MDRENALPHVQVCRGRSKVRTQATSGSKANLLIFCKQKYFCHCAVISAVLESQYCENVPFLAEMAPHNRICPNAHFRVAT